VSITAINNQSFKNQQRTTIQEVKKLEPKGILPKFPREKDYHDFEEPKFFPMEDMHRFIQDVEEWRDMMMCHLEKRHGEISAIRGMKGSPILGLIEAILNALDSG